MSRSSLKLTVIYAGLAFILPQFRHVSIADTIVLKNGNRLDGQAKRTASGWTIVGDNGQSTDLDADSVDSIEVSPHPRSTTAPGMTSGTTSGDSITGSHSATAAQENLASLRRSVEALNNPVTAVERFKRFVDQSAGTTAAAEARADLATWQDRLDRGLVKVGTNWVTPEEKAAMAAQADGIARDAAALIEQGRTQEAEQTIQTALDADGQNSSALYLRGLVLFGKDQVVAARKAFESMLAIAPNSGAGLNNLAVILWKQNQPMGALQNYDRSIMAWPIYKAILDNVSEALAAVPADQQKNPILLKLRRRFNEQDAQLQVILARDGQFRWGATWVDQPTLDKLKVAEKSIADTLARINTDATTAQTRVTQIDQQTAANNATMTQLQASAYARDAEGHIIQLPLPPAFYTLQNENERMSGERATLQLKLQSLTEEAKKTRQSMPVPPYTGLQRLIGVEGMPAATTQPSTQQSLQPSTQATTMPAMNGSGVSISIGPAAVAQPPAADPTTAPANGPILIPLP